MKILKNLQKYINEKEESLNNAHIIFWLIKDICWSIDNKIGILFIAPTIFVSVYILFKSKNISQYIHNTTVCFWITSNSLWMISELYKFEETAKPFVVSLFIIGLLVLITHYINLFFKNKE